MQYKDYFWLLLLFVLGCLMLINPKLLWKIEYFFTVKDGEPTELYIALMRLGGVVFLFIAIIFFVLSFA